MHGVVEDFQPRDGGCACEGVGVEEFGLGDAAVGSFFLGWLVLYFVDLLGDMCVLPSHHFAPLPFKEWPEAPETLIFSPETENRGPLHSSNAHVVSP